MTLQDTTRKLARLGLEVSLDALPPKVVESAKLRFLDTIAVMVAGSRHPSTLISLDVARHTGGNPAASVVGHRDQTSTPLAAFVNGVAAHALEFCDFTPRSYTHLSACLVPGALVVGEELGVPGRRLLEAFVGGFEVGARIGRGLAPYLFNHGWHPNGITGALGVSVAAANMMGLDLERTRMAMGLAASQGSGVRKNVGSMGKAFHHGHGTRCGVFAALLAERGYKVDPDIIEGEDVGKGHGRFGLADTFCGIGNYRLDRMIDELGRDWELDHDRTVVRLHPTSTPAQSPIDTMLDLARQHGLTADQVDKIELDVTRECMTIACYPDAPNSHRAKFCLRYMMAVSLIDKRAGIAQFTDDRVKRQDVQSLMDKVTVTVPADLERHAGTWGENGVSWGENRLRVTLKGHKVLSTARSHARGYPQEPATWDDLAEKFAECADGVLSKSRVDDVTAMVVDLDRLGSTADLMAALRVSD